MERRRLLVSGKLGQRPIIKLVDGENHEERMREIFESPHLIGLRDVREIIVIVEIREENKWKFKTSFVYHLEQLSAQCPR